MVSGRSALSEVAESRGRGLLVVPLRRVSRSDRVHCNESLREGRGRCCGQRPVTKGGISVRRHRIQVAAVCGVRGKG